MSKWPNRVDTSVVVPSYNGVHRLQQLLPQLQKQDFGRAWEVLVCLDGSTDGSSDYLEGWCTRLPLRILTSTTRQGVPGALNAGFANARGRVLVRCDDDLLPGEDFVSRHTDWHSERTDLGVIGLTRDVFPETAYARAYGRESSERAIESAQRTEQSRRWIHWAANNSIHRESWELVGGYDPLFLYGQDSEFGFRLHQAGVRIELDPKLTTLHTGPATSVRRRTRRAYVSGASRRLRESLHPDTKLSQLEVDTDSRIIDHSWNTAVKLLARQINSAEKGERLGAVIDRLLEYAPPHLTGRAISLLVESSALAGYQSSVVGLDGFFSVKVKEVGEEVGRECN